MRVNADQSAEKPAHAGPRSAFSRHRARPRANDARTLIPPRHVGAHVRALLALVPLALALVPPPAAAVGGVVVATGPAHYDYWNSAPTAGVLFQTCDGDGIATATFEPTTRRFFITFEVPGCTPVYSLFTFCRGGEGQAVTCRRSGEGFDIDVTLGVDGALSYSWIDATFTEVATGQLTRL